MIEESTLEVIRLSQELNRAIEQRDDLLAALKPFAYLARVMEEGQMLNYRGVYVSYDQALAAQVAIAKARGET